MKIDFNRTKYVVLDRGRFGVYERMFEDKHIIREAQDCWPFPKLHLLNESDFKYVKGYAIDEPLANWCEEALM